MVAVIHARALTLLLITNNACAAHFLFLIDFLTKEPFLIGHTSTCIKQPIVIVHILNSDQSSNPPNTEKCLNVTGLVQ